METLGLLGGNAATWVDDEQELLEREARIERVLRAGFIETGLELRAIRDKRLYKIGRTKPVAGRLSFTTFEEYVETRWEMGAEHARRLIEAASVVEQIAPIGGILPSRESHVRPLLKLDSDSERASAWEAALSKHDGEPTAKDIEAEVALIIAEKERDWVTLDEWNAKTSEQRVAALSIRSEKATFNKQDTDSIDWAQWSWNPITGCKHDCPYCYARDIAERFYPQRFAPSILPGRLAAPANMNVPEKAMNDIRYRNIFTCSMADLFGRWVPSEWIEAVLGTVRAHSEWNFLFLTKFPKRMSEFNIPANAWMGTTVDLQIRVKAAEQAFAKVKCGVKWLSIEPMLEPLKFEHLDLFDWMVIGGGRKSTLTPEWTPPMDWIVDLHLQARAAGLRLYYKSNAFSPAPNVVLPARLKELPWEKPKLQVLPKVFEYLGKE